MLRPIHPSHSKTIKPQRTAAAPFFMPSTNPYFRPNQPRLRHVESAISSCLESYFITLTTKRRLTPETFARELHETLNRVNSKLFGTAFKRRRDGDKVRLRVLAHQELTVDQGLHTHLLVGVPDGALTLKANPCTVAVPDLIIQTWLKGDPQFRRREAQNVQVIHDFEGVRSYISKDVRTLSDFDQVDLLNTH